MKIENWDRCSGITYKGYIIVNPMHSANYNIYEATILDLNRDKNRIIFRMEVNFIGNIKQIAITLSDSKNSIVVNGIIGTELLQTLKGFIQLYESMVESYDTKMHFVDYKNSINGGITIDYGKMMQEMLDSIKESDEVLKNIKEEINKL